jgi:hypothetical protein
MSVGYSGTPLFKKLGIKPNFKVFLIDPPENYFSLLGGLPEGVSFVEVIEEKVDLIHAFIKNRESLNSKLQEYQSEINENGSIWISWYKKTSKIPTDVTEDLIRDTALAIGLVDVKVCAVDEKWSGLKLVIRRENRRK